MGKRKTRKPSPSLSPFTLLTFPLIVFSFQTLLIFSAMARKKLIRPITQLEALRGVRKELPPPTRAKEDEKKYRRPTARRKIQKEVERAEEEG